MRDPLTPMRILVVEDDPFVAATITDLLEDARFEVDGPYPSLSDGVAAVAEHLPDGAVLDIRLDDDHDVGLLAGDLELYGIPFILCSGLKPRGSFETRFGHHPFVSKERATRDLVSALRDAMH